MYFILNVSITYLMDESLLFDGFDSPVFFEVLKPILCFPLVSVK
jgi:hypothetical protein